MVEQNNALKLVWKTDNGYRPNVIDTTKGTEYIDTQQVTVAWGKITIKYLEYAYCTNSDGTSINSGACTCGTNVCTSSTGLFCVDFLNRCSKSAGLDDLVLTAASPPVLNSHMYTIAPDQLMGVYWWTGTASEGRPVYINAYDYVLRFDENMVWTDGGGDGNSWAEWWTDKGNSWVIRPAHGLTGHEGQPPSLAWKTDNGLIPNIFDTSSNSTFIDAITVVNNAMRRSETGQIDDIIVSASMCEEYANNQADLEWQSSVVGMAYPWPRGCVIKNGYKVYYNKFPASWDNDEHTLHQTCGGDFVCVRTTMPAYLWSKITVEPSQCGRGQIWIEGVCTDWTCSNEDGSSANSGPCRCGTTPCTSGTGFFCTTTISSSNSCSQYPIPQCSSSQFLENSLQQFESGFGDITYVNKEQCEEYGRQTRGLKWIRSVDPSDIFGAQGCVAWPSGNVYWNEHTNTRARCRTAPAGWGLGPKCIRRTSSDKYTDMSSMVCTDCGSDLSTVDNVCTCRSNQIVVGNVCTDCGSDLSTVDNVCTCRSNQIVVGNVCTNCRSDQIVVDNVCTCRSGQGVVGGVCTDCRSDQIVVGNLCTCRSGQGVVGGVCTDCRSDQIVVDNVCICSSGHEGCDTCRSDQIVVDNVCTCRSDQIVVGNVCTDCGSDLSTVDNVCTCRSDQIVVDNVCTSNQMYKTQLLGICGVKNTLGRSETGQSDDTIVSATMCEEYANDQADLQWQYTLTGMPSPWPRGCVIKNGQKVYYNKENTAGWDGERPCGGDFVCIDVEIDDGWRTAVNEYECGDGFDRLNLEFKPTSTRKATFQSQGHSFTETCGGCVTGCYINTGDHSPWFNYATGVEASDHGGFGGHICVQDCRSDQIVVDNVCTCRSDQGVVEGVCTDCRSDQIVVTNTNLRRYETGQGDDTLVSAAMCEEYANDQADLEWQRPVVGYNAWSRGCVIVNGDEVYYNQESTVGWDDKGL